VEPEDDVDEDVDEDGVEDVDEDVDEDDEPAEDAAGALSAEAAGFSAAEPVSVAAPDASDDEERLSVR
jgi:hypothetical protein